MSYTAAALPLLIGGLGAEALGCSASGALIVGTATDSFSNVWPVYWTGGVIHQLPVLFGVGIAGTGATACNAAGTIIVGSADDGGGSNHACFWDGGPSWAVHDLGTLIGDTDSVAASCSSDASLIVGYSIGATTTAVVWTGGTPSALPMYGGGNYAQANHISGDGTTIVGYAIDSGHVHHAVKWTGGPSWTVTVLASFAGETLSAAFGVSNDGSTIVGGATISAVPTAVYWQGASGFTLPPVAPSPFATAATISGDGTLIGGEGGSGPGAVIWVGGVGQQLPFPATVFPAAITASSTNGSVFVGTGLIGAEQVAAVWTQPTGQASIADLWFGATPGFFDLTDVTARRLFISAIGGAQSLGANGQTPLGGAPAVFLSEVSVPPDFANNLGIGGAFPITSGALTAAVSSPPGSSNTVTTITAPSLGVGVLGDYRNGNLYAMNMDTLTDNGTPRKWLRTWRGLPERKSMTTTYHSLLISMETGSIQVPEGTNPQVMLRWSSDGGHTWDNERFQPVGETGETGKPVKFNRLGSTRRFSPSGRVFELSSTDEFKVAILDAEVDVS